MSLPGDCSTGTSIALERDMVALQCRLPAGQARLSRDKALADNCNAVDTSQRGRGGFANNHARGDFK
ncbi:hypothetical protein TSA66_22595 [Noviherbaspirillum autotrophicum]|uniref:Uncharacterized protein n=1 Tax=Noviherbaspirillum autotrophicum TaxID=709839 RepID=A0A0C1Y7W3_9BURK|nr:hypothetical protein TSA66_22595 [Noviherbaspirillum autotrophicum]